MLSQLLQEFFGSGISRVQLGRQAQVLESKLTLAFLSQQLAQVGVRWGVVRLVA